MRVLAVETSGGPASVAVADENKILGEFSVNNKKNHSQTIMLMVDGLLKMLETDLSQMDYIALSQGPGSFTGLRIGAATAKGLAHGAKKPMVMVPTLDALAYNVLDTGGLIAPVMDARRGQVYTAVYKSGVGGLKRLSEYMAIPFEELLEKLEKLGQKAVFLGDGCFLYNKAIIERGHTLAPINMREQRASSVAALAIGLARSGEIAGYGESGLIYLRKPQAEREYEEKLNSGGR